MHSTPVLSMILFSVAAVFGALGQYLYKSGADAATEGAWSYVANPRILAGIVCYVTVMVLFVAAFKKGGSLSVLYPIYASTFIWGAVIAWLVYSTPIKPLNVLGMGLLVLGMFFMGK